MSDIRKLWQDQGKENGVITLDEIHARAGKTRVRLGWGSILLGCYSLLAVFMAARMLLALTKTDDAAPGMGLIAAALLAAHLWIIFALWMRRPRLLPPGLAAAPALDFHRQELERQHRAARSVWAWYILPFVPVTLLALAVALQNPPPQWSGQMLVVAIVMGIFMNLLWYGGIWLAFSRAASRIELELHRLARLRAE